MNVFSFFLTTACKNNTQVRAICLYFAINAYIFETNKTNGKKINEYIHVLYCLYLAIKHYDTNIKILRSLHTQLQNMHQNWLGPFLQKENVETKEKTFFNHQKRKIAQNRTLIMFFITYVILIS